MKSYFKNQVSAFALEKRGATAATFALSFIPAMALLGSGLDYSRALRAKQIQQSVLDAAVLQIAPLAATKTTAQLKTQATSTINALRGSSNTALPADDPNNPTVVNGVTVDSTKTKVCLTASTSINTAVMNVVRISTLTMAGTSCAQVGGNYYEIALVLDNSGSMNNSSKIGSLRTAATSFVTTMFTLAPNNVNMSIVPFSDSVAVDPTTYRTASWVDTTGQSSWHWKSPDFSGFSGVVTSRFDIFNKLKALDSHWDWAGCFETQPYPQNVNDTAPSAATADSLYVPMLAPDEPDASYTVGSKTYSYPNNYMKDTGNSSCTVPSTHADSDEITRQSHVCKYMNGTKTTSSPAVYGPNYSCLSQPLLRMTTSSTTLNTKIAGLTANGATNIHEGFMWGWRTISPLAPFADGKAYNSLVGGVPVKKVIVLMTDGFNTWASKTNTIDQSDYEGPGYFTNADGRLPTAYRGTLVAGGTGTGAPSSGSYGSTTASTNARAALDALTIEACANARAAGVDIWAIGFSVTGDLIDTQGQNMLKSCTGSASKTFIAADATGLNAAFSSIANGLGSLRLVSP